MGPFEQIKYELQELRTKQENLIRTGTVTAIYADAGLVDVAIEKITQKEMPFLTTRAGSDNTYWMPSVGEQGVVLSPSGNLANAMFLPALNSVEKPVVEADANLTVRVWEDGAKETYDKANHVYQFQVDPEKRREIDLDAILDTFDTSHIKQDADETEIKRAEGTIKIDGSETKIERATGALKAILGTNQVELTMILLNLLGAHVFPTGITTFQSPVGPVMFAPATSPPSAPSPPAESAPNSDGEATQTPPSQVSDVSVQSGSSLRFTIPALQVNVATPSGPGTGTTVPLLVTVSPTGRVNLEFPARDL